MDDEEIEDEEIEDEPDDFSGASDEEGFANDR